MTCPECGQRQWRYDANTLTCKNGHRIPAGEKSWRPGPKLLIPVTAFATFALDLIVRTLT